VVVADPATAWGDTANRVVGRAARVRRGAQNQVAA
jgi:hypothetical protein